MERELTEAVIGEAFQRMNAELTRDRVQATVFVFGGAAMVAGAGLRLREMTYDVDAVWDHDRDVLSAAWATADAMGLSRSWLNNRGSQYLPPNLAWDGPTMFSGAGLRAVHAAGVLLAMKVDANRRQDAGDISGLIEKLGYKKSRDVVRNVEFTLGRAIPIETVRDIEEVMRRLLPPAQDLGRSL